jgi:hypothetical protein
LVLLLPALLVLVPKASAAVNVSYQYIGVVQGTVAANSTATVNLYLQETATNGAASLIASEGGLYGAGVSVYLASGSGSTITAINGNTASIPNGFDGTVTPVVYANKGPVGGTGSAANLLELTNFNDTIPPAPSGTTTGGSVTVNGNTKTTDVFLGTVTVAIGASANATYDVVALKNAPSGTLDAGSFNDTLTATNGYDIDNNSSSPSYVGAAFDPAGTFTISTSSVPEPSSVILTGLAFAGLAFGAYRRSKNVQAEAIVG